MKILRVAAISVFIAIIGTLANAGSSPSIALGEDSIYIVLSYDENDLCGKPQLQGILQGINEGPNRHFLVKTFYLDSKRLSKSQVQQKVQQVLHSIKRAHPRVVVTVDDAAFLYVGLALNGQPNTFVVFSGINGDISAYNKISPFLQDRNPISNITGVVEHLFLKEQVDFLKLLHKWPCEMGILYSTDFMGEKGKKQIGRSLQSVMPKKNLRYFPVSTLSELKIRTKQINQSPAICAYIPLVLSIRDEKNGRQITLEDLVPQITQRIKKIDIAVNKTFTKAGFFGGANVDMFHMGYQAGQMVSMLLDGVEINKLQVEKASRFQVIVNKNRAKELGLKLEPDVLCLVDELI